MRARAWRSAIDAVGVAVERDAASVRLRFPRAPEVEPRLRELAALENECCNVGGVAFDFVEAASHVTVRIVAPERSAGLPAVQALLDAFAAAGARPDPSTPSSESSRRPS